MIYFMDYAIAQTVTLYRAFRDFIYLFMFTFFFFYERKGVARSQISIRSLLHVHLQCAVN